MKTKNVKYFVEITGKMDLFRRVYFIQHLGKSDKICMNHVYLCNTNRYYVFKPFALSLLNSCANIKTFFHFFFFLNIKFALFYSLRLYAVK